MNLQLQDVNDSNWRDCSGLQLSNEEEKFISSNVYVVAEWIFETESILKAIYSDNVLVGMLAYYLHNGEHGHFYWLYHLMIETKYQSKGYGENAVKLAITEMRQLGATEIRTMHMPGNIRAQSLYKKLGFEEIGTLDGGDIFLRLSSI